MGGVLSVLLLVVLGLFLVPSSAIALSPHHFLETFGSANEPSFIEPEGLAVDQSSGDLFVIDGEANTISRYNQDGTPAEFSALGSNVIDGQGTGDETPEGGLFFGSAGEVQIAVDDSGGETDGDIYVTYSASPHAIEIFAEDGSFLGQLTESSEGVFTEPCGVAVDPSGNVYVGDFSGHIHKYEPAANPPVNADNSANLPFESNCTLAAGAGPTDGFIFPVRFNGKVSKLDSTSGEGKYEVPGENTTVTVDPASGHVYTASGSTVNEYDFSGPSEATLLSGFSVPSTATGIAVDAATGNVYVARAGNSNIEVYGPAIPLPEAITEAASEVDQDSAILHGTVSAAAGPETSCEFQYTTEAAFESDGFEGATSLPCVPPGPFTGSAKEAVSAEASGLSSATKYFFRVVGGNENGTSPGEPLSFFAPGPPIISESSASQITATSARITGLVNSNGAATSFVVQYVTEAQFEESGYTEAISVPAAPRKVGSGTERVEVIEQLTGLSPATTYHFRLVASNLVEAVEGPDQKFTTFSLPTTTLADGRAYEMISPPQKTGEVIPLEPAARLSESCKECLPGVNKTAMPMQSAPDGESVLYTGQPFAEGLAAGPNEYVSDRRAGGWETESLSSSLFASGEGQGYEAFSADLSRGALFQIEPALSPDAPAREGRSFANLYLRSEDGSLQPLIAEEPPNRDPGFPSAGGNQFRIRYSGANLGTALAPPFSHLIFEANDALTEEVEGIAPEAPEIEPGQECTDEGAANCNLYEWIGGQLRLVNVLPGNKNAASNAVIGSGRLLTTVASEYAATGVDHAISADGSRIFWSTEESGQVYARIDGEETLEIPGPGSCKASVPQQERACFLTASADGSKILLSDGQVYELSEGTEPEAYEPSVDLTEGQSGFRGILGTSEDLSQIYFVDTQALTEESEENANGEHAEDLNFNLYAWSEGATPSEDTTTFIGALLGSDNTIGLNSYGDWSPVRPARTAQVSSDGSYLAFMSQASLTPGYDNTLSGGGPCNLNGSGGPECFEVYEYATGSQTLTCASCNPSGSRPIGPSNLSLLQPGGPAPPFRQPGNLSTTGNGRLFFESQDALSPQDTNGDIQDVYEWEPNGVGSCERVNGCVSLITNGQNANDSMFLDSTPSGNDAFFITREQLLPRDKDQQLDLYDARVGGGFEEITGTPCSGEACKGPISSPPVEQSGNDSLNFIGSGNPPPKPGCKQGFVQKHGKCLKKRHKHHHKRLAKHNRGGFK